MSSPEDTQAAESSAPAISGKSSLLKNFPHYNRVAPEAPQLMGKTAGNLLGANLLLQQAQRLHRLFRGDPVGHYPPGVEIPPDLIERADQVNLLHIQISREMMEIESIVTNMQPAAKT